MVGGKQKLLSPGDGGKLISSFKHSIALRRYGWEGILHGFRNYKYVLHAHMSTIFHNQSQIQQSKPMHKSLSFTIMRLCSFSKISFLLFNCDFLQTRKQVV